MGLGRGAVEIGGIHLIAHGGYHIKHGESRRGEFVKQMIAAIARLVDTDILSRLPVLQADAPFVGHQLHPVDIGKVAFKLGIVPRLAGNGVVVRILPETVLGALEPVLPHSVRAAATHDLLLTLSSG